MSVSARLGSIVFSGPADSDGDRFLAEELEGWDFPEVQLSRVARPKGGDIITWARTGGRAITIVGNASSPVPIDGPRRLRRKIEAALAPMVLADATFYVDDPAMGLPSQAQCRVEQAPSIRRLGPSGITYEVYLLAPESQKVAQATTSVVVPATITTTGNAPAPWVATLAAATASDYLDNGGARISFTGTLPAGTVVDSAARTVMSGTTDLYGQVAAGSTWWDLAPGANVITSVGSWTIVYRESWL